MRLGTSTRALITGASKGIGRAIAVDLAGRGARVGLLARGQRPLDELADELPGEPIVLPADVSDRNDVERATGAFVTEAGGLDLLVANAGIAHYGQFAEMELDRAEEMVAVNVVGCIYSVSAALERMLEAGRGGHIVVVSSGAGLRAFPGAAVYGATKAANRGFAEGLRHELAGTGIGLTTVYPGEVDTDLHAHELDRLPEWRKGETGIDPAAVASRISEAIEADDRAVYAPALVRALALNGVLPGAVDRLLRRLRGPSAAPRRD